MKSFYMGLLALLFAGTAVVSCSRSEEKMDLATMVMEESEPIEEPPATPTLQDRKMIREGEVSFQTESLLDSRQQILDALGKYGGYVASDQEWAGSGRVSQALVVRIPSDRFDDFFREATKGVGRFEEKNIRVRDVTEEFVDVESRIRNMKEMELRYVGLLEKAVSVKDVLEIEREVGELRSEIESLEGRLKLLQSQVSFSTLTMTYYEEVDSGVGFWKQVKEGLANGWEGFLTFLVVLVNLWPVFPLLLLVFGLLRWLSKAGKREK